MPQRVSPNLVAMRMATPSTRASGSNRRLPITTEGSPIVGSGTHNAEASASTDPVPSPPWTPGTPGVLHAMSQLSLGVRGSEQVA